MNYLKIKNYVIFLAVLSLLFISKSNAIDGHKFRIGFCVTRTKPSAIKEEYTLTHVGINCMYQPLSPDLNHDKEGEPGVLHLTYPAHQESMVCTDGGNMSNVVLKNSNGCLSEKNLSSIMIERDDHVYSALSNVRTENSIYPDQIKLLDNTHNKLSVCPQKAYCDAQNAPVKSDVEVWFMYKPY
ncbi:MAG: hypothetical protein K2P99_05650 [Burkholderiales bacterium]|nr:hypothetical protein [Burkholderiales bacterium]